MKQKLILLTIIAFITVPAFATVYTVSVGPGSSMTFSPATGITMHPDDTITWVWAAGTHTTTSTTIPTGAATWDHQLASTGSFSYVPTVVGTYNYKCTYHESMGMVGSFTVVSTAGINPVVAAANLFSVSPNPASGSVHITFANASTSVKVTLIDENGRELMRKDYNQLKETEIDLHAIPSGTYVLMAEQGTYICKQKLVVSH